ncbi:MAG: DUF4112 domain-containing protein [Gemmatimonadales bacterium]
MPTTHRLARLRRLSHWLDDGIRIPGTRLRVGLDPILGLVPGIGDAAGAILSAAIVVEAARQGVSRYTLVRMGGNIAVDAGLGAVPFIGDLFDAGWKANTRNLALLERHVEVPSTARRGDRLLVLGLAGLLVLLCVALAVGGAVLTVAILGRLR